MHIDHDHVSSGCAGSCSSCNSGCEHTNMEKVTALKKYMASHNAAHTRELASLAEEFRGAGNVMAYQQVMAAVSDYEKGNLRLTAVLNSLDIK